MRGGRDFFFKRTVISRDPFVDWNAKWSARGAWPAQWIGHPDVHADDVVVTAFCRKFVLHRPLRTRIHVTADERYELFCNGERVASGSEWGSPNDWFYDSYDVTFAPGNHVITARTWHLGHEGPSPCAQMSLRPAFIFAAEGEEGQSLLSTGIAQWECKILRGYYFLWPYKTELPFVGARLKIKGDEIDWGFEGGIGGGWKAAVSLGYGVNASMMEEQADNIWLLRPSTLPQLFTDYIRTAVCRHAEEVASEETETIAIRSEHHRPEDAQSWNALIENDEPLSIPPYSMRRIILDLRNYYCGRVELTTTRGAGSLIRVGWAESFYETIIENAGGYRTPPKGNRDEIEGKYFRGFADWFEPDGGEQRRFRPLWWSAGRYLEVLVRTGSEALTLERLKIEEQHYPYRWCGRFNASDHRLVELMPIYKRTLEMCSHETYMDCPHYEQLMYIADTRLEVLQTYVMTRDDRLPRKALYMFDASRRSCGLTQSRFPTRVTQILPPFSLWWIAMVHDYLMWRNDLAFIKERLLGVRSVLEAFCRFINKDGLVEAPVGWNFVDWVPAWDRGCPPGAERGVCSIINLHFALALQQAALLEQHFGENSNAGRNRRLARAIINACKNFFWDHRRGMFADDTKHSSFSEHAQCFAILSNAVSGAEKRQLIEGLLTATDLHRATIYFSHYLFETYRITGHINSLFKHLDLWYRLLQLGLKTTIETPEPSRSDCHGWGAHPMFHYFATILGIRPSSAGFATVRIVPQLGPLRWATGTMPHPSGSIKVDFRIHKGTLEGSVELPRDIEGELVFGEMKKKLRAGKQVI